MRSGFMSGAVKVYAITEFGLGARGSSEGIVDFAPYNYEQIPSIISATSMRSRLRFIETKRDAFEGPIRDQNGNLILPKGEQYNDDYIYNEMDWFVEGVVGEAPGDPPQPVE